MPPSDHSWSQTPYANTGVRILNQIQNIGSPRSFSPRTDESGPSAI